MGPASRSGPTWVLQRGLGEHDHRCLLTAIGSLGLRVEEVAVVPFVHDAAEPLPRIDGPCVVYGSGGLLALARRQGWSPAGWDGEGFSARRVASALGSLALNGDAVTAPWSRVAGAARLAGWSRVFVRPDAETKKFAGRVFELGELEAWAERLRAVGYFEAGDAAAIVAPARRLGCEWRLFVVGGAVVASAQYAQGGQPERGPSAPPAVLAFAKEVLHRHSPAPCLALDVAEVWAGGEWELRAVEMNSINSAGFHGVDPGKIVEPLSDFVRRGGS